MPERRGDPSVTRQIKFDAICLQFEQAWRRDQNPAIESFLESSPEAERPLLLPQLLLVELEYIEQAGSAPKIDEYLDRFPNEHAVVRQAFEEHASAQAAASPSASVNGDGTIDQQPIAEQPGNLIGRYKLLEQIGEGGMGVVYMAEQQRPVRRKVALKIIKPGMDTKQVVARFEAERQALAMMDHPNIARVLDAGSTDSRRPYFVMELVRGVAITEYCDQAKLATRERLKLFTFVCQAVQHAHTKGIIHRDLKPSNVLVTLHDGVPVPKIIDFGVSKAMGQQLTEKTMFTAFAQMVGTPLYMSPEQAEMSGLDIDTRSDIYSLGVLLYELLAGVTPFDRKRLHTAAFDEIRRIIREEEPDKPSTRVSTMGGSSESISAQRSTDPSKLKQMLRGELDWIVMKTLEKDRNRRYETANALVAEVNRYLNGDPVEACPPSTTYRLRKFARRYKSQVAIACGFAGILLASSVVAWLLYADARRARNDAVAANTDVSVERDRAVTAEETAKNERIRAEKERDRAESERDRADQHAVDLKNRLYDYNLIRAQVAYRDGDKARALDLLDECLEEQRGWEWNWLERLTGRRMIELAGVQFTGAASSPVESRLAVASDDGTLRLVDLNDGRTLWRRPTEVTSAWVGFSPQGDLIVVHTDMDVGSGRIEVWDVSGKQLWAAERAQSAITMAVFTPNSSYLAFSSYGGSGVVELLNARDGSPVWQKLCQGAAALAVDQDSKHLFVTLANGINWGDDATLARWTVDDAHEQWSVPLSYMLVPSVTPDGSLLTVTPHALEVRDPTSGKIIEVLQGKTRDLFIYTQCSPDGNYVATIGARGKVVLWDWQTKTEMFSIQGFRPTFADRGDRIVVQTRESTLHVYSIDPPPLEFTLSGHGQAVVGIAFSPDGKRLVSAGVDGALRSWNPVTGQETRIRSISSSPTRIAYSPAGTHIATSGGTALSLWNAETGELEHEWHDAGRVWALDFSSDGKRLLAGTTDEKRLQLYDVETRDLVATSKTSQGVKGVVICNDGRRAVLLSGTDGVIAVWDIEANTFSQPFRPAGDGRYGNYMVQIPHSVSSESESTGTDSSGSDWVAAAIHNTIEIWDVGSSKQLHTLRGHDAAVRCLASNDDGSRLYSGDDSGVVKVWNLKTGEQVLTMHTHEPRETEPWGERGVLSLALSPDGKTLASSGADHLVKLWETTLPTTEITDTRRLVEVATNTVDQEYARTSSRREVLDSLTGNRSLDPETLKVAFDLANVRGDFRESLRPRSIPPRQKEIDGLTTLKTIERELTNDQQLARELLINLVESESGIPVDATHPATLPASDALDWYRTADRLTTERISQSLLPSLIDNYPNAHHFVYIRGQGFARRGQWRDAYQDLLTSLSRIPEKSSAWQWQACQVAALTLYLSESDSNTDKYRRLTEKLLADFSGAKDPRIARTTAIACLISPAFETRVDRVVALLESEPTEEGDRYDAYEWFSMAKGMAEYRRGRFQTASEHLKQPHQAPSAQLKAAAQCFQSMCLKKSQRFEEARETFNVAEQIIASRSYPQADGSAFPTFWHNWINAQLAYQEAAELIQEQGDSNKE